MAERARIGAQVVGFLWAERAFGIDPFTRCGAGRTPIGKWVRAKRKGDLLIPVVQKDQLVVADLQANYRSRQKQPVLEVLWCPAGTVRVPSQLDEEPPSVFAAPQPHEEASNLVVELAEAAQGAMAFSAPLLASERTRAAALVRARDRAAQGRAPGTGPGKAALTEAEHLTPSESDESPYRPFLWTGDDSDPANPSGAHYWASVASQADTLDELETRLATDRPFRRANEPDWAAAVEPFFAAGMSPSDLGKVWHRTTRSPALGVRATEDLLARAIGNWRKKQSAAL